MSPSERDPRDWPQVGTGSGDAETADEPGERDTLDAPSGPEPSWRPETPAWDRPVPRSKTTTVPVGGPRGAEIAPAPTTRSRRSLRLSCS